MVEFFGEKLFLQGTFSIHWFIWIQLLLLVLLLVLLLLLYSSSSSSSDDVILAPSVDTPLHSSQAACITTTTAASTSSSHNRQKKKLEEEDGKLDRRKDGFDSSGLMEVTHPCHIVRLARMAFLKCFGLGSPKDNPTCREQPPRR